MPEKHIDPHVHCRDWRQFYKSNISDVMKLARSQGVVAIFDMPNTDPLMIHNYHVEDRIKLAQLVGCDKGYYLYIGATKKPMQVMEAEEIATKNPKVVGIKYFTTGTNLISLTEEWEQKQMFNILSDCNYNGVVVAHCEKESLFKKNTWNPRRPWTWNDARPFIDEVEAAADQIEIATDAGFEGNLHITHASSSSTVDFVDQTRKKKKLNVTCGVTPHHLLYSTSDMRKMSEIDALMLKVNPPIRDETEMLLLRESLKEGKIDWIETDHAPHSFDDKIKRYASGIPSLNNYQFLLGKMREWGIPEQQISDMTYNNIKETFPKVVE